MNRLHIKAILTAFFSLLGLINCYASGLYFKGANSVLDPRSRYEVFKYKEASFSESITIDFEIRLDNLQILGDILTLKADKHGEQIRLVYVATTENSAKIILISAKQTLLSIDIDDNFKWIPISLNLDSTKSEITLTFDDQKYSATTNKIPSNIKPSIIFGCKQLQGDAVTFSIRGLKIYNDDKSLYFPLDEHDGSVVRDSQGRKYGLVDNPHWLVVNRYKWEEVFHYSFDTTASACHMGGDFMVVTQDTLFKLSLGNYKLSKLQYSNQAPMYSDIGTSFVDQQNKAIYVYEAIKNHETTVAKLNVDNLEWSSVSSHSLSYQRHHHISHFDPTSQRYTIFGGFGSMKYSNEFNLFSLHSDEWTKLEFSGDTIPPRFFSSAINTSDSTMLIFAGKGNKSGDQTLGADYFLDLYSVDLTSQEVTKLWEKDPLSLDQLLIPVRQGILSKDKESFYTIMYDVTKIHLEMQLYKFSIATGDYSTVAGPLPMISGSIRSTANIFKDYQGEYIYCYTHLYDMTDKNKSTITLHRINAELLTIDELNTITAKNQKRNVAIIILVLFVGITIYIRYRHKLRGAKVINTESTTPEEADSTPTTQQKEEHVAPTPTPEISKNSIYMYGAFTVYDSNSVNITHLFSPKIKQLFFLLLFKSCNNGEGISSIDIQTTLWFDYPVEKSKNLRGVTMYNLRNVLRLIDGVDIVHQNGRFKVVFEQECYCDYIEFLNLAAEAEAISAESLSKVITIATRGTFLQQYDDELFDSYKERSEESIMSILLERVSELFERQEYDSTIRLCQIINRHEQLNESSLWYEVKSLCYANKKSEAKSIFVKFTKEYYRSMGEEYKYNFSQFAATDITQVN